MTNDKTAKLTAVMGVIMLIAVLFLPFIGIYVNSDRSENFTLIELIGHASSMQVLGIILAIVAPFYLILEAYKDKIPAKIFVIPTICVSLLPLVLAIISWSIFPKGILEAVLFRLKIGYYVYFVAAVVCAIANIPKTRIANNFALLAGAILLAVICYALTYLISFQSWHQGVYSMLTVFGADNSGSHDMVVPIMSILALVEMIIVFLMLLSVLPRFFGDMKKNYLPSKIIASLLIFAGIGGMALVIVLSITVEEFVCGPAQPMFLIFAVAEFILTFRKVESV